MHIQIPATVLTAFNPKLRRFNTAPKLKVYTDIGNQDIPDNEKLSQKATPPLFYGNPTAFLRPADMLSSILFSIL